MKKVIHRTDERGIAEHGWLHSRHSFSFAQYHNPGKMGFGLLRVLNDDIVEPGTGFGTHPHENMEIISIVLDGALEHKDSIPLNILPEQVGITSVIYKDDAQVMSAGTGITHSEYNHSETERVKFLQLWIIPKERNVKPRYEQKSFPEKDRKNKLITIASGDREKDTLYIHQNAEIDLGIIDKGKSVTSKLSFPNNGIYLFVLEGEVSIAGENLADRDAIGTWEAEEIIVSAVTDSKFVLIEVPMH